MRLLREQDSYERKVFKFIKKKERKKEKLDKKYMYTRSNAFAAGSYILLARYRKDTKAM